MNHILGNATKLPLKSETFDGLLAKDIIEHLLYPDSTMAELRRILKKGGKIIIETATPYYKHFWDDYTHIRPFTKKSLRSLLLNNDFSILKIECFSSCDLPGFPQIGLRDFGVRLRNILTKGRILRATNIRAFAVKK
ncbi:MAG: class I SAM-dependent methyltransferase [Candidatus Thermoplasmatota archaeon]|nr:class I SAM-dependent methyltransferase [Candidatus Thermoplasmatota archaeon]